MQKTAVPFASPPLPGEGRPTPEEVRAQLRLILESPAFLGSKRSRQFLEHVCERCLAGDLEGLKERSLAIEVFGRHPESDLGDDTIVRVGAREVRRRLVLYYSSPEGSASPLVMDLARGNYVPEFHYASAPPAEPPPLAPSDPTLLPVAPPPNRSIQVVLIGVMIAGASIAAAAMLNRTGPNAQAFSRFWEPVLKAPDPLLMAVGHPIVYHPSARAVKMSEARQPPLAVLAQRPIQLPPGELDGSDMIPVLNQYVGFGDMVAGTEVASMLARKSKAVRVRMASTVPFADMRQAPALLVGGFTNRWTMELGQSWRFQFRRAPDQRTIIVDSVTGRQWSFEPKDDGSASTDYILICRIPSGSSGGLLIVAAGVKQFGTEAAGRLLTDPEQLGAILRKLPAKWEDKKVQLILQTKVIGNTPAEPELVAWNVW